MTQSFSPPARRIIALGLLALLLLIGASLVLKAAGSVRDALAELDDRRFRVARLNALAQRTAPSAGQPVPQGMSFQASSRDAAQAEFAGSLAAAADAAGVTIEGVAALPADPLNPPLIKISFAASGPEPALLGFINEIEQRRPAIRLPTWRMSLNEDAGGLRLNAVALAVWETGP